MVTPWPPKRVCTIGEEACYRGDGGRGIFGVRVEVDHALVRGGHSQCALVAVAVARSEVGYEARRRTMHGAICRGGMVCRYAKQDPCRTPG